MSTPSVTNNLCNGASAGKIVIAATGGTGTITYSISPIVGTQSPAGTFNNLTANDGNNCTKATTVTVTEHTTNQGDNTDYWIAEKQNRMTGVFEKLEIHNNT